MSRSGLQAWAEEQGVGNHIEVFKYQHLEISLFQHEKNWVWGLCACIQWQEAGRRWQVVGGKGLAFSAVFPPASPAFPSFSAFSTQSRNPVWIHILSLKIPASVDKFMWHWKTSIWWERMGQGSTSIVNPPRKLYKNKKQLLPTSPHLRNSSVLSSAGTGRVDTNHAWAEQDGPSSPSDHSPLEGVPVS